MLSLAVTLLVIGGVLLLLEAFIPGFGVCGFSGLTLVIVSAVIMVLYVPYGVFILVGELAVLGAFVFFLIKTAKKNRLFEKLVLRDTLGEDLDRELDLSGFPGKTGVATTPLRPVGTADFAGLSVEVYAAAGFVEAGEPVTVVDIVNRRVMVRPSRAMVQEAREN